MKLEKKKIVVGKNLSFFFLSFIHSFFLVLLLLLNRAGGNLPTAS